MGFGSLLRRWREARGHSQRYVAAEAGMSTRHLSFLETERCGPSEHAVLRLGRVLELPGREVQRLLIAAGFAGDWNQQSVGVTPSQLTKVGRLLRANDPYPAFITDPGWKVSACNEGGEGFFRRCLQLNPRLQRQPFDIAEIVSDPCGMGRIVANAETLIRAAMEGLFQLEPDPKSFGSTAPLFESLSQTRAGSGDPALQLAPDPGGAWEIAAEFVDQGFAFTLELLAIPFAGPCAGYGLLLSSPADDAQVDAANDYFSGLIERSTPVAAGGRAVVSAVRSTGSR